MALLRGGPAPASLIAGGTDLMVQMKEHVRQPAHVINIKKIPGMDDFAFDPREGLLLGTLVTTHQVGLGEAVLRSRQARGRGSALRRERGSLDGEDSGQRLISTSEQAAVGRRRDSRGSLSCMNSSRMPIAPAHLG